MTRLAVLVAAALLLGGSLGSMEAYARPPPRRRPLNVPAARAQRSEADRADPVVVLRAPGPPAVLIRGGPFLMGSSDIEITRTLALCKADPIGEECPEEVFSNEYPPHDVSLGDYWIDSTEVTVTRYRQCVAAGPCAEPPYASGGERFDRPDFPVVLVTWQDASTFCTWAGGRLPTEAEWERAARGMTNRRYPWGQVYNPNLSNHGRNPTFGGFGGFIWSEMDAGDGFSELAPVGSFPDGRTLDGIDDLAGNVEEWVGDFYAPEYPRADQLNPTGPSNGDERVVRGGSYLHGRTLVRAAARGHDLATIRRPWRGFRCVVPARRGLP